MVATMVMVMIVTTATMSTASHLQSSNNNYDYEADYVILGSGPSATAAALELTKETSVPISVLVLERGVRIDDTIPVNQSIYASIVRGDRWNPAFMSQNKAVRNGELFHDDGAATMDINGVDFRAATISPTTLAASGDYAGGYGMGGSSNVNAEIHYLPSKGRLQKWQREVSSSVSNPSRYWSLDRANDFFASVTDRYKATVSAPTVATSAAAVAAAQAAAARGQYLHIRKSPAQPSPLSLQLAQGLADSVQIERFTNDDANAPNSAVGGIGLAWDFAQKADGTRSSAAFNLVVGLNLTYKASRDASTGRLLQEWSNDAPIPLQGDAGASSSSSRRPHPVRGSDLRVLLETTALYLEWGSSSNNNNGNGNGNSNSNGNNGNGNRSPSLAHVSGVVALQNGRSVRIQAKKRVIVCLGINTPEFLQRSGVGPAALLQRHNVPVVINNANVGEHMENHPAVVVTLGVPTNVSGSQPTDPASRYLFIGRFPTTRPQADDATLGAYNVIGTSGGTGLVSLIASYMQAQSRGRVVIQSADPLRNSLVDGNYMTQSNDVEAMVRFVRDYAEPWVASLRARYSTDYTLASPSATDRATDASLRAWVAGFTYNFHWTSTCKAAASADKGVVDATGLVFGSDNLHIGDVTILPSITDGNPCAAAYYVGDLVAEAILDADGL